MKEEACACVEITIGGFHYDCDEKISKFVNISVLKLMDLIIHWNYKFQKSTLFLNVKHSKQFVNSLEMKQDVSIFPFQNLREIRNAYFYLLRLGSAHETICKLVSASINKIDEM